jgi:phosphoglycerate dehydrogenase-like enzyme
MALALFYQPSFERLRERIHAAAPTLDVALYDEDGRIHYQGREVTPEDLRPEYFWIHGELFKSARLPDYFHLMLHAPSATWLHTINTGLDQLPYLPLLDKGMRLTNNHAQAISIAEYVLGQVLAHYQDVADFRLKQQQQSWKPRGFREISGTRWLLVGFGHIGQAIAQRAKAFGASVTAVRRSMDAAGLADHVVPLAQLGEVLPDADVVVLACASNAATRHLVDAEFLSAMKPGSVLVNIARGDLVVEDALQQALDRGTPELAILDVFEQEPLPRDAWPWTHPRVRLTPHTSNAGSGMRTRSEAVFIENLRRISNGEPLLNEVSRRDIL